MPKIIVASADDVGHIAAQLSGDVVSRLRAGTDYDDQGVVTQRWIEYASDDAEQVSAAAADLVSGRKIALAQYAADKRWRVETGGCPWSGHVIATDRDSQSKLMAEFVAIGGGLRSDPSPWKMTAGFVSLTNAQMATAIAAARTHVATAFATEAAVLAQVNAGTITTTAQIDAAAWPANA